MKSLSEYRQEAWDALHGNWAVAALYAFIFELISTALSCGLTLPLPASSYTSCGGSLLATFVLLPLQWGFFVAFLQFFRTRQELQIGSMFEGFTQKRVWFTMILKTVYTLLWTLLLIIPGIIKSYSYAMTEYIIKDNEDLTENAAIEESMRMMKGYKMKLFLLDLSFIGWFFLALLTLGILFFWLLPYVQTARAAFYEDLKKEYMAEQPEIQEYVKEI